MVRATPVAVGRAGGVLSVAAGLARYAREFGSGTPPIRHPDEMSVSHAVRTKAEVHDYDAARVLSGSVIGPPAGAGSG
jgi:hypothetical protein